MAQILIRRLDDDVKRKLQRRARLNGRSTEAEVREILQAAVQVDADPTGRLGSKIAARFAGIGLDDDVAEHRGQPATPAHFDR